MRRADRRTKERRAGDDQCGRRFAGEAVNGFQFEDLMPHGFDDFPAAHGSTERHKGGTEALDPEGDGYRFDFVENEEGKGDHPHRFLRIVHTVAGRHERRREHLKPRERRIELVPYALCAQEHDEEHDQQPHTESSQRGEDQRQQYFGQDGAPVEG